MHAGRGRPPIWAGTRRRICANHWEMWGWVVWSKRMCKGVKVGYSTRRPFCSSWILTRKCRCVRPYFGILATQRFFNQNLYSQTQLTTFLVWYCATVSGFVSVKSYQFPCEDLYSSASADASHVQYSTNFAMRSRFNTTLNVFYCR